MYKPLITDGSKKFGNNRWLSYSSKLKRNVFLFSDLEYEHWLLVESDPKIVEFCEQPVLMDSYINEKSHTSIIDMWVKYSNGNEEFVEVKYSSDLTKEKVKKQISIQKNWCNKHGFQHNVRTEEYIRANKMLLSNLKLLMKGNKQQKQQIDIDRLKILKVLRKHFSEKVIISSLIIETQIPQNRLFISLGKMILQGEVCSDISLNHFGKNTEVWIDA
ncbi:TnsA endonuclease N-terminal domain-containing protein [Sporosarcina sp. FSL W7-1349]|uniref:TnsA endonuclease N-terminal domain-containing protein n=1 Tax=Sporosarcina sp. FSL W7-1349 TaxID=2921561 RepID=UPI0030F6D9CE